MNGHCLLAFTPAGASQAGSHASAVPTAEVPSQSPQSFLPSAALGLVGPSLRLESPFPVMTSVIYVFAQSLPPLLSYDSHVSSPIHAPDCGHPQVSILVLWSSRFILGTSSLF